MAKVVTWDNDITYERVGKAVRIKGVYLNDWVLDEESLRASIENVKRNRAVFKTEAAYLHELTIREGALAFLRSGDQGATG